MRQSVSYVPETADHFRASATAMLAKPWVLYLFCGFFVVLPWLSAIVLVIFSEMTGRYVSALSIATLVVAPLVASGGFCGLIWLQARGHMRRVPAAQGEHHYVFDNKHVLITAPGLENRIAIGNITKIQDGGFGMMMFSGPSPILFIPSRAFASVEDKRRLQTIFKQVGENSA